ncbi:MAG: hypothetical protein NTZ17_20845 [Phycisphaerae bacterium]|nr:hypothetical protein [Phycisphaerae bacterium]
MQMSRRSRGLRTSGGPIEAGRRQRIGTKAPGWLLIFLLSASVAYAAGPIGSPRPPAPPSVPPIISGSYSTDLNSNHISDALESAGGELSIASDETVEVELIFNEPVTQRQIDEFLRLGGQITYIYRAISYGWNGYISRQSINLLPSEHVTT